MPPHPILITVPPQDGVSMGECRALSSAFTFHWDSRVTQHDEFIPNVHWHSLSELCLLVVNMHKGVISTAACDSVTAWQPDSLLCRISTVSAEGNPHSPNLDPTSPDSHPNSRWKGRGLLTQHKKPAHVPPPKAQCRPPGECWPVTAPPRKTRRRDLVQAIGQASP
uniref:Uncharacterized protein n=1 Tax=Eutreptiella gymnastica TaxID=73025 RepID=A0A7S1HYT1_9EUGL|mmetsp:Transcript_115593/g.201171  ORF Transcript_115593/g.201171 Transcript_115593/m.201171 type:complete len:166 (+) Transcript_115593:199-696(+)